jgi:hypothetical protein
MAGTVDIRNEYKTGADDLQVTLPFGSGFLWLRIATVGMLL